MIAGVLTSPSVGGEEAREKRQAVFIVGNDLSAVSCVFLHKSKQQLREVVVRGRGEGQEEPRDATEGEGVDGVTLTMRNSQGEEGGARERGGGGGTLIFFFILQKSNNAKGHALCYSP